MVDYVFVCMAFVSVHYMDIPQTGVRMVLVCFVQCVRAVLWFFMFLSLCGNRSSRWWHHKWSVCRLYLVGGRNTMGYSTWSGKLCDYDGIVSSCEIDFEASEESL